MVKWTANTMRGRMACSSALFWFVIWSVALDASHGYAWQKPGCHQVGHTRKISIPDCVQFDMTTNACRGFCVSYSIPSGEETTVHNPNQVVTAVGQCCNIMETEDVKVRVMCLEGPRDLVFKSAKSCGCFHCKKD